MSISNTQLSFKSTDKSYVSPTNIDGFNLAIESYTYNSETGEGTINFASGPKIVQGTGVSTETTLNSILSDGTDADTTLNLIPTSAFEGCDTLQEIGMPDSVTSIGDYAFKGCENLESMVMSNGIQSIGTGITSGCVKMLDSGKVVYKGTTYTNNEDLLDALGISVIDTNEKVLGEHKIEFTFGTTTSHTKAKSDAIVGDICYYGDTPIGVVVITGDPVKIMSLTSFSADGTPSLTEQKLNWGINNVFANVTDGVNGKSNTINLVGLGDDYSAANACYNYSTIGTNAGDWYLPSKREWKDIDWTNNKDNINSPLSSLGNSIALVLNDDSFYWSSTESYNAAWGLYGNSDVGSYSKYMDNCVRAFYSI